MLDSATDLRSILKDPSLLTEKAYIAGEWVSAADGKTFPVINPARGDVIANVADMSRDDARRAIEVADKTRMGRPHRQGTRRRHAQMV
jgi:succinate-semialdehyde dehydrogenase / glutarate-semialdehyde dehydrogenase